MSGVNIALLSAIGAAAAAGQVFYISQADGMPLVQHNPPLIVVNGSQVDPSDNSKIGTTLTEAGARMVSEGQVNAAPTASQAAGTTFAIETGFTRPKIKRGGGGGGAPTKYPFDTLQVGTHFFIANSEVESGDAYKTLSSAVGSANQRYAVETGNIKTVTRAKRGDDHKAIKGADGKNVTETVQVAEKRFTRKFIASKVEAGKQYGSWTAPADGAVVARTE